MRFMKGLFLKMKNFESKRIGLFYLALSSEFSSGILTTKYSVFAFFFLPYMVEWILLLPPLLQLLKNVLKSSVLRDKAY